MKRVLVLGSTGYLGANLVAALREIPDLRLMTTSGRAALSTSDHVVADLSVDSSSLAEATPEEVWICARPRSEKPEIDEAFYTNLEALLDAWVARSGPLARVVYFSTQLVYRTPSDDAPIGSNHPVEPVEPYARLKLRGEVALSQRLDRGAIRSLAIHRLPLLLGGIASARDRDAQLLYLWRKHYAAGWYWDLADEKTRLAGNSFLFLPDYCVRLAHDVAQTGLSIRNPVSGDFTYSALDRRWRIPGRFPTRLLPAPSRATFYLRDEYGLPRRTIEEAASFAGL